MLNETTYAPPTRRISFRHCMLALAWLGGVLLVWLASGALVPQELLPLSARLQGSVTIFLSIFIEALPFLLAGVLAASAIHLFVSAEQIQRLCPRHPVAAAVSGALLGLIFPVCECGSIPTARQLMHKGAPVSLGVAFVLAAPVVNPIVIASTWVAFGGNLTMVAARVGLTLVIAVVVALLIGLRPRTDTLVAAAETTPHCNHAHSDSPESTTRRLLNHASGEFFEMGRYLVIGALLAALLQTLIPRSALLALGQGPLLSVLVLMALAVLLSICSTVDAFVALAFASSFLPGALLAFLVFGPMIDIKAVLMLNSTFHRHTVALIVLLTSALVLLVTVALNLVVAAG